ncbi:hypothetical protein ASE75_00025 [Sphingomonas sp. Leaf17]|uniref:hypothetical protein n=1 Tax=Sphingomonas sp. Leaf17 TaxID=1735683 RepID=UPI0006FB7371|nr:hypothetical protein [Sphingomonas sp. Leaf17]KQM67397.1 hypothetical protein ASE75_00025 [Sphingomonas sp. Leaf17]
MIESAADKVRIYQFRKMGYIGTRADIADTRSKRPADSLAFVIDAAPDIQALYRSPDPALYVWLNNGQEFPWYVGKAGKGLKTRWDQWISGFYATAAERRKLADHAKATTGLAMAERIRRQPAGSVELWARPAGSITLLGLSGTLVSAEEEILIKLLRPRWNDGGDRSRDDIV